MTDGPRQTADEAEDPGIVALLSRILGDIARLVSSELTLARAEAKAALRSALTGLVALCAALVLAILSLVMLADAAAHGLVALGLRPPLASLAVAVAALLIAAGCVRYALHRLSQAVRGPERTMRNLRRDAETLGTMVERDA